MAAAREKPLQGASGQEGQDPDEKVLDLATVSFGLEKSKVKSKYISRT